MRITYELANGTPNYTVKLISDTLTYTNTHTSQGTFEFSNVANGTYEMTAEDSKGCEFRFGQVVVDNDNFNLSSILISNNENSQVIDGVTIESTTKKHLLLMNPKIASGAVASITFGFSLITEESPLNNSDVYYAISGVEAFKDNVSVFQQQISSNESFTAQDEFTINDINTNTKIELSGSVIVRSNTSVGASTSGFYEIYIVSMKINSTSVGIITNGFNINGNLAS